MLCILVSSPQLTPRGTVLLDPCYRCVHVYSARMELPVKQNGKACFYFFEVGDGKLLGRTVFFSHTILSLLLSGRLLTKDKQAQTYNDDQTLVVMSILNGHRALGALRRSRAELQVFGCAPQLAYDRHPLLRSPVTTQQLRSESEHRISMQATPLLSLPLFPVSFLFWCLG